MKQTKRLLEKILVVDLEAICWLGKKPKDQESEIIEVGICDLDLQSGGRNNKDGLIIKPQHSTISEFWRVFIKVSYNWRI